MYVYTEGLERGLLACYLGVVENEEKTVKYQIIWIQDISKVGKVYGPGFFRYQKIPEKRRGNWCETLKKRIKARHEKRNDWRDSF